MQIEDFRKRSLKLRTDLRYAGKEITDHQETNHEKPKIITAYKDALFPVNSDRDFDLCYAVLVAGCRLQ